MFGQLFNSWFIIYILIINQKLLKLFMRNKEVILHQIYYCNEIGSYVALPFFTQFIE